jgi:hypothetical protein
MERGAEDAHLDDAALNRVLVQEEEEEEEEEEEVEASELNTLLQEGAGRGQAEEGQGGQGGQGGQAEDVARRVVARWRALVAERKGVMLLRLLALPDLFQQEVLKRLDPVDRTMVAQVGRPWLAAVLASGLPRVPKGVRPRLPLVEFCTSAERQGITLVHFSAQLEPCLTHTKHPTPHPTHPQHPLNTSCTTPMRTPYLIKSAKVELRSERV